MNTSLKYIVVILITLFANLGCESDSQPSQSTEDVNGDKIIVVNSGDNNRVDIDKNSQRIIKN